MTADTTELSAAKTPPSRHIELVLAHTHLRLGMLPLARTELETLAAEGALDSGGLVDLAEVRWRTGDLVGAGEVAEAALKGGTEDPVAFVVASEAASRDGRPSEARRLAMRALAMTPEKIDLIFAGMPRSSVWGPDAHEPAPTVQTLFDRGPDPVPPLAESHPDEPNRGSATPQSSPHPMTLGLWAGDEEEDPAASTLPEPAEAFDAGREALVEGSFDEAAFRLGLALRLAPALAPAVLEITDGARARSLILLRGDAYRQAGHETEARQAYVIAARGGLPERRSRVRMKSTLSGAGATAAAGLAPPSARADPDIPDEAEPMAATDQSVAEAEPVEPIEPAAAEPAAAESSAAESAAAEPVAEAAPPEPDATEPETEPIVVTAQPESATEVEETQPAVDDEVTDQAIEDRAGEP